MSPYHLWFGHILRPEPVCRSGAGTVFRVRAVPLREGAPAARGIPEGCSGGRPWSWWRVGPWPTVRQFVVGFPPRSGAARDCAGKRDRGDAPPERRRAASNSRCQTLRPVRVRTEASSSRRLISRSSPQSKSGTLAAPTSNVAQRGQDCLYALTQSKRRGSSSSRGRATDESRALLACSLQHPPPLQPAAHWGTGRGLVIGTHAGNPPLNA